MSEVQAPTTVERGTVGTVLRRWMVRPEAPAMVFLAILTQDDGTIVANRCTNSQVWRRGDDQQWRIIRDHTGVEAIPLEEARRAFTS